MTREEEVRGSVRVRQRGQARKESVWRKGRCWLATTSDFAEGVEELQRPGKQHVALRNGSSMDGGRMEQQSIRASPRYGIGSGGGEVFCRHGLVLR